MSDRVSTVHKVVLGWDTAFVFWTKEDRIFPMNEEAINVLIIRSAAEIVHPISSPLWRLEQLLESRDTTQKRSTSVEIGADSQVDWGLHWPEMGVEEPLEQQHLSWISLTAMLTKSTCSLVLIAAERAVDVGTFHREQIRIKCYLPEHALSGPVCAVS